MAPEDFAADANQHDTAENFGPFAQQRADKATYHDPQRRHDKGGAADRQRGGDNADLQEGQADADRHGVKAGGEGGGDQQPEAMPARRLARLVAVAAKPSMIIRPPRNTSRIKAIQWFHSRTNWLASMPSPQPTSGVRVSIAPKISPVRTASENLGLCRVAPLPIEAAKASIDMPKARRRVADKFMCLS